MLAVLAGGYGCVTGGWTDRGIESRWPIRNRHAMPANEHECMQTGVCVYLFRVWQKIVHHGIFAYSNNEGVIVSWCFGNDLGHCYL